FHCSRSGGAIARCLRQALASNHPRRCKSIVRRRIERATTEFDLTAGRRSTSARQRLYACGWPVTGALGIARFAQPTPGRPLREQVLAPARLAELSSRGLSVVDGAAGYGFTLLACRRGANRGILMACGANNDGQLGPLQTRVSDGADPAQDILLSSSLNSSSSGVARHRLVLRPTQVRLPVHPAELASGRCRLLRLSAGRAHSLLVTSHGAYAFGNNAFGQCGRPAGGESAAVARLALPCPPESVQRLVCGQDSTYLLTADGRVYSCGLGADGQLGLGGFDNSDRFQLVDVGAPVADLACRADTVLALGEDGCVYGWGNSEYGQLGTDALQVDRPIRLDHVMHSVLSANQQVDRVAAVGSMCALLTRCGRVWVWGYGRLGLGPDVTQLAEPRPIPDGLFGRTQLAKDVRIVQLDAGMYHFAAVTNSGSLYTWGDQRSGSLGLGHDDNQCFPLQVSLACRVQWTRCGVDHTIICGTAFA
ncbi:hypothetical protein BOX15_Mlig030897g4, partial [Macrostomum lignano]